MRTLDDIIAAVRVNETYTEDEARYAIVALDVLLFQMDFTTDTVRMAEYFKAATSDPKKYAGWVNDPENPEFLAWRKAFDKVDDWRREPEEDDIEVPPF